MTDPTNPEPTTKAPGTSNASKPSQVSRPAALVTGGAVRLGRCIAQGLAGAGYDIALHYNRSDDAARTTAAELRDQGVRCEIFSCDFSDTRADFPGLIAAAHECFPGLATLVNSASVYDQANLRDTDAELLDRQFAVNFRAPLLLMRSFAARVGRGNIVNIIDNKIAFHQYQYAAYLLSKRPLRISRASPRRNSRRTFASTASRPA